MQNPKPEVNSLSQQYWNKSTNIEVGHGIARSPDARRLPTSPALRTFNGTTRQFTAEIPRAIRAQLKIAPGSATKASHAATTWSNTFGISTTWPSQSGSRESVAHSPWGYPITSKEEPLSLPRLLLFILLRNSFFAVFYFSRRLSFPTRERTKLSQGWRTVS